MMMYYNIIVIAHKKDFVGRSRVNNSKFGELRREITSTITFLVVIDG